MTNTSRSTWMMVALMLTLGTTLAMAQTDKTAPPAEKGDAAPMHGHAMPGMGPGMGPGVGHGMGEGKGPALHAGGGMCSPGCCGGGKGMHAEGMRGPRMGRGPGGMGGPGMAMMMKALDLTDAQRGKMADIHERVARKNVQTQADLRLANMDLQKLLRADNPDARALGAQIDRIATLRASVQKARLEGHLEMRGLLAPEQQKKMREMHRGGPGGPMGPGMGRGHGWGMGLDDEEDGPEDGMDDGLDG